MISVIPINWPHPLTRHTPLQEFVVTAWSGGRGLSAHLRKHDVFAYAFTHTHTHAHTCEVLPGSWVPASCEPGARGGARAQVCPL